MICYYLNVHFQGQRVKRNSLTHTTTLEFTPLAAIFVSSRSYGTTASMFRTSRLILKTYLDDYCKATELEHIAGPSGRAV